MPPLVTGPAGLVGIEVSPQKAARASRISEALPDVDIVVLCEAFCKKSVAVLCERLKAEKGLTYRTPTLLSTASFCASGKFISGGVVIVSRYPFEIIEELPYGSVYARDDGLANKGVLFVKVKVEEQSVNIFASHTQAWDDERSKSARWRQLEIMKRFIDEKKIAKTDIVLVAGDLNVPKETDDYARMVQLFDSIDLNSEAPNSNPSFDHVSNFLASKGPSSGGYSTTLDYILVCNEYRKPERASAKVLALKARSSYMHKGKELWDLSDHYPLVAEIDF